MGIILYIIVAGITVYLATKVKTTKEVPSSINGRILLTRSQLNNQIMLLAIFLILFCLSAFRLNVGNDYAKYVEFMHLIRCKSYVPTEIGFNALVYAIYYVCNQENFLLVFAIFAFFTQLFFLHAIKLQGVHFGWCFFLYMSLGYYFMSFTTVRYYLALSVALLSIPFLLNKEWGKFILLIVAGSLFHKSLLVVLALYIVCIIPLKKWMLALASAFFVSCLFLSDLYLKVVVFLYPSYEDTEYLAGGTSVISILRCMGVLILFLICFSELYGEKLSVGNLWRFLQGAERPQNTSAYEVTEDRCKELVVIRFYFVSNLLALCLYVFCSFVPVLSRIGHYLMITQVLMIPYIICNLPEKSKKRRLLSVLVVVACVGYFLIFLRRGSGDGIRILPYQTFFFHDMVNILSDVN